VGTGLLVGLARWHSAGVTAKYYGDQNVGANRVIPAGCAAAVTGRSCASTGTPPMVAVDTPLTYDAHGLVILKPQG